MIYKFLKTRFYIESLCDTIKWVEHLFISPKVPLKMPALLYFLRDAKGQKREIHYHLSTCIHLVVVYVDLHKHLCLIMCPLIVVLLLTHQNRKQIWNHFRKWSKQDNRLQIYTLFCYDTYSVFFSKLMKFVFYVQVTGLLSFIAISCICKSASTTKL